MKPIKDLSRQEKVTFLKAIEAKKIDIRKLNGKPPLFLMTKFDVWIYISQPNTQTGIALTKEAQEALEILRNSISSVNESAHLVT